MKIKDIIRIIESTVDEAEEHTIEAQKIVRTLQSAGYRQLGSGADATVWAKEGSSQVLKIIMPDAGNITKAAYTFKTFVNFCLQHQDLACLPKFIPIDGEYYSEFRLGSKTYIQLFMERLAPIQPMSFEEGLVWYLSDFASNNVSWNKVKADLSNPQIWAETDFSRLANQYALKMMNLSEQKEIEYQLLYTVMVLLYKTGKVNKMYWDLHTENVMKRDDGTLVIIDPWFEHEGSRK